MVRAAGLLALIALISSASACSGESPRSAADAEAAARDELGPRDLTESRLSADPDLDETGQPSGPPSSPPAAEPAPERVARIPAGSPPLPPPRRYRYAMSRSGALQLGGERRSFDDTLDFWVWVAQDAPDRRTLRWSPNPDPNSDNGEGAHRLSAQPGGIFGTFLTVYGGGMPPATWNSWPLWLPEDTTVGREWRSSGRGSDWDKARETNYQTDLNARSVVVAERMISVSGTGYPAVVIDRNWTFATTYENRPGNPDRGDGVQTEIFSPALGLVVCNTTRVTTPDGDEINSRAVLDGAAGCP